MGIPAVQVNAFDQHACEGDSHVAVATRITADLMNLELLGRWPRGQRDRWVVWSIENGATIDILARVLDVTRERIRQIYNRALRERAS